MTGRFHKMHGLGNDFVVIDARTDAVAMSSARARAIADRHQGIGCDQLIMLEPAEHADATMRIWNADGGEVEACGNAARAVALLLDRPATVVTAGGTIALEPGDGGATVDMGVPRFEWNEIPVEHLVDTRTMPVAWEELARPMAINVGNPHLVFFVEDCDAIDLGHIGPIIEHDPLFPERINVNVATVTGPSAVKLRVWERGAGLTRACGTGACATAVAAIRSRRVSGPVAVTLPGGTLSIEWSPGSSIRMTGPATYVYSGETDWSRFGP